MLGEMCELRKTKEVVLCPGASPGGENSGNLLEK